MSASLCPSCGGMVPAGLLHCASCGELLPGDGEATSQVPRTPSPAETVARRADQLRQQLAVDPGQSALVLLRGPGEGSLFRLGLDVVTLGRAPTATVLLNDISVSRRHAEITPVPAGYRLTDLGSLNGTYVNRTRVNTALLAHGDVVQIGLFRFRFVSKIDTGTPAGRQPSGRR